MDVWDNDALDLGEEAHLTFVGASGGEIAFVAVKGFLDVRYGSRGGAACAAFSWLSTDEARGRGWVMVRTAGRLVGHLFIHQATSQASTASGTEFFNSLLDLVADLPAAPPLRQSYAHTRAILGNEQHAGSFECGPHPQEVVVGRRAPPLLEITDGREAEMSCFGELFLRPFDQGSSRS